MKRVVLVAVAILGSMPAGALGQTSCQVYFQLLRADSGSPGLNVGLDSPQRKWWDSKGQKKYPGLCVNGSVTSGDKPRYVLIWSKSNSIGQGSLPSHDVYGQTASALRATAPHDRIYQRRWDQAAVTVVTVRGDGTLMLPPVYFETDDHVWIVWPSSTKVLQGCLGYLKRELVFLTPSP